MEIIDLVASKGRRPGSLRIIGQDIDPLVLAKHTAEVKAAEAQAYNDAEVMEVWDEAHIENVRRAGEVAMQLVVDEDAA